MEYPYFKGLEADRYSFYRVPKALVKADLFQKMSGDAKLLYAVLLDRMSLSIKNGWQDKHGNAYIICTIEEVIRWMAFMNDSISSVRQTLRGIRCRSVMWWYSMMAVRSKPTMWTASALLNCRNFSRKGIWICRKRTF